MRKRILKNSNAFDMTIKILFVQWLKKMWRGMTIGTTKNKDQNWAKRRKGPKLGLSSLVVQSSVGHSEIWRTSRIKSVKVLLYYGFIATINQGTKVGTLGRQNERNSSYVRLAHISISVFCFRSVCLMKSNCYSSL